MITEDNCGDYGLTEDFVGYYAISNAEELYWFMEYVNAGNTKTNAVLMNNIVVNEGEMTEETDSTSVRPWTPIGNSSIYYKGTFDGQGHTISGLYFNNENQSCVGLFGKIYNATIQNVGVTNSYIKGSDYVGGVCGYNENGTITNCYNTGAVTGTVNYAGGVCGFNDGGTVSKCYNEGAVNGDYHVGEGAVNGYYHVGGVCGDNYGTVSNCYNKGAVNCSYVVGGVCGFNEGTVSNCYNTGAVDGTGTSYVGGVCGNNYGTVSNCYYLKDTETTYYGIGKNRY